MSLLPKDPVAWHFSGDEVVGKTLTAQAQQMLLHVQQQLKAGQLYARSTSTAKSVPGSELAVTGGFGGILVEVYAPITKKTPEALKDPGGIGALAWQARGFFITPATSDNVSLGRKVASGPTIRNPPNGWGFITKYEFNTPESVFRRELRLPSDKPIEKTGRRSLLRYNRLLNSYDLEEFFRRDDGTLETDKTKQVKNVYRPGVYVGKVFLPQYKSYGDVEDRFQPRITSKWSSYWPIARQPAGIEAKLLKLFNDARKEKGLAAFSMPYYAFTDDVAKITAFESVYSMTGGHNFTRYYGAKGAHHGNVWMSTRHARGGAVAASEITVRGTIKAEEAFKAWKGSPEHWAAITGAEHSKPHKPLRFFIPEVCQALPANTLHLEATVPRTTTAAMGAYPGGELKHTEVLGYNGTLYKTAERAPGSSASSFVDTYLNDYCSMMRPVSYPYKNNRIYGVSMLPFTMLYTPKHPKITNTAFIRIHGREHRLLPDVDHPYTKALPTHAAMNVLAAAYYTDTKGRTYVRAMVHIVAYQTTNIGVIGGTYERDTHSRQIDINRIDIIELPFDATAFEKTSPAWGLSAEPEFKVLETMNLPRGLQTIYSAAMSQNGKKAAISFSTMEKHSTTMLPAAYGEYPADIFRRRLREEPLQLMHPCAEFGEVVRVYEWADGGVLTWLADEFVVLTSIDGGGVPGSNVEVRRAWIGSGDISFGLRYSSVNVLERIKTTHAFTRERDYYGPSDMTTRITVDDKKIDLYTSKNDGDGSFEVVQKTLVYVDWYKPEHTVYIQHRFVGAAADLGPWTNVYFPAPVEIGMYRGLATPYLLKELEGYETGQSSAVIPTGTGDWSADGHPWKYVGVRSLSYSVTQLPSPMHYDAWTGSLTESQGGIHSLLRNDGNEVPVGTKILASLSVATFGGIPPKHEYAIPSFDGTRAQINGFYNNDYVRSACIPVLFWSQFLDSHLNFYEAEWNFVDEYLIGREARANLFNVAVLDGDVIVEGLWAWPVMQSSYILHEIPRFRNGAAFTSEVVMVGPARIKPYDDKAPMYFRASTLDVDAIIGAKAKYLAPFGVIE